MAKKRMISADLLDNDVFLDLSISAKALYFYLILKADDDGIVAKPKSVVREIQATNEDLEALIETRYILSFPSGVICIKHWKMHNSIPKDRYKPTTYQEELSTLIVRDDGSYTEKERYNEKMKNQMDSLNNVDEAELYDYSSVAVEEYWKKTVDIYPKKRSLMVARQYYLDKLKGVPPEEVENLAKLIFRAVKIYLGEVMEDFGDYKYAVNFDKWFKNEYDECMRKAEENLKKQNSEQVVD